MTPPNMAWRLLPLGFMRRVFAYLLVFPLLSTSASGCFLYFDDDGECQYGAGSGSDPGAEAPAIGLRNPLTGTCEYFGGGDIPVPCDDRCGPCPGIGDTPVPADREPSAPLPSWGYCQSQCSSLEEGKCMATAGCRGIYDIGGRYLDCWATDQTGPIQGSCDDLNAFECSLHDDCVAIHRSTCDGTSDPVPGGNFACTAGNFERCAPEDPPPAACSTLTTETECVARTDCNPHYRGEDCTCDTTGCTCNKRVFIGCS